MASVEPPVVADAVKNKKKKKKNNNKKKAAPSWYKGPVDVGACQLVHSKKKGIHVAVRTPVAEGDVLFEEDCFAAIPLSNYRSVTCQRCLKIVSDPKTDERLPTAGVCTQCSTAVYCSPQCMKDDEPLHLQHGECAVLQHAEIICMEAKLDIDVVAFTARMLATKRLRPDEYKTAIEPLPTRPSEFDKSWRMFVSNAAEQIRKYAGAPEPSVEELLDMTRRLQLCTTPLYPLSSEAGNSTTTYAIGVGRFTGHLTPSCMPNAVRVGDGTHVTVRALRPLQAGEELTICVVQGTDPRALRQETLASSKKLKTCHCPRCSEPLATSIDRFAECLLCDKCCEDVIVEGKCVACGAEFDDAEVTARLAGIKRAFSETQRQYREPEYKHAVKVIGDFVSQHERELPQHHSVLFRARTQLLQLYNALEEHKEALRVTNDLLKTLDVMAPHSTTRMEYLGHAGRIYEAIADYFEKQRNGSAKKVLYNKKKQEMFQACYEAKVRVFGENHPQVILLKKRFVL